MSEIIKTTAGLLCLKVNDKEKGWVPLKAGTNLIGKTSGPLLEVDPYLAPLHLQIDFQPPNTFILTDLESLNGVFVKLTNEEKIVSGAIFRVGQQLLKFENLSQGIDNLFGSPRWNYWGKISSLINTVQQGSTFLLHGNNVIIGRTRGEIIFADDQYISGAHAQLSYREENIFLQDLGSSNGTFLKITGEKHLQSGASILLGHNVYKLMIDS